MVALVIMGVCGSGKTSIAIELSKQLQCEFRDADEFHSVENKKKMSKELPLTDEDRMPWLLAIHHYIKSFLDTNSITVVTCSALKKFYRQILVSGQMVRADHVIKNSHVLFIYLKGASELIAHRLQERKGHFMPPALLQSQLDTLEEPDDDENHLTVNIDGSIKDITSEIIRFLRNKHISL